MGFYLAEHPLSGKISTVRDRISHTIAELLDVETGEKVKIAGIVTRIKKVTTKKNNSEMIFATMEDLTGSVDCVVFPKTYELTRSYWFSDNALIIIGKIDRREDKINLLVESIYPLDL